MSENKLQVVNEGLETQHIKVTAFGVDFDGKPSTEEWYDVFMKVGRANVMTQFYLGDMVKEAEFQWGEKYDDLVDLTDYDNSTLRKYVYVARRFDSDFREAICSRAGTIPSWTAFKIVAPLEDDRAMYYLEMLVKGNWSTRRLEEEVLRYQSGGSLPERAEEPVGYKSFNEFKKKFFKDFTPSLTEEEYDEQTWLSEIIDIAEARLEDLGVIDE